MVIDLTPSSQILISPLPEDLKKVVEFFMREEPEVRLIENIKNNYVFEILNSNIFFKITPHTKIIYFKDKNKMGANFWKLEEFLNAPYISPNVKKIVIRNLDIFGRIYGSK